MDTQNDAIFERRYIFKTIIFDIYVRFQRGGTLPETNSKFAPEKPMIGSDEISFGDDLFSGGNC